MLYDQIAAHLDTKLRSLRMAVGGCPIGFGESGNPKLFSGIDSSTISPGLWLSPKQLITLTAVAEEGLKLDGVVVSTLSAQST